MSGCVKCGSMCGSCFCTPEKKNDIEFINPENLSKKKIDNYYDNIIERVKNNNMRIKEEKK